MVKIVVIGATGNVGSALLRLLQDHPEHQVFGVTRRKPKPGSLFDAVEWHSIDIATNRAATALANVFDGAGAVVNLAWGFQPGRDVRYLAEVGVGGTRAVLAGARAARVPHVVLMSSVGAYSAARRGRVVDESWPVAGVPSCAYSVQKAAAEAIVDEHERAGEPPIVCRLRPGLVLQRAAAGSLLRYGLPAWFPAALLAHLPFLPLDRTFAVPVVHADDVAAAITRAIDLQAAGAFNLSAETPLTSSLLAAALGTRPVHVPRKALRALVGLGWMLRAQRLDPGWIDLAFSAPLLSTDKARTVLDWKPTVDADQIVRELITGIRTGAAGPGPVLRPRTIRAEIEDMIHHGPVSRRREA